MSPESSGTGLPDGIGESEAEAKVEEQDGRSWDIYFISGAPMADRGAMVLSSSDDSGP